MSEQQSSDAPVYDYQAPSHVQGNVDIQALVAQAVAEQLARERAQLGMPAPPKIETAAERAQRYVEEATIPGGVAFAQKGINEHLDRLYHVLSQVLVKLGGL